MKLFIHVFLGFLIFKNCDAKEYAGFNLCEKITAQQIDIIANNYDVGIIENKNPNIQEIKILNYPIAKGSYSVNVYIYKNVLHRIIIDALKDPSNPKLVTIIEDKYKTKYEASNSAGVSRIYDTFSIDKNIQLQRSVGFGFEDDIQYSCPGIEKIMRNELELERKNEAIKQSGGSKL